MQRTSDIIVVGGGVIGLSCAWRLAQRGAHVTVIEQNSDIPGASRTSLGVLAYPSPLKKSAFHELHRTSLGQFFDFAQELEQSTGIEVGYRRCGGLELIPTEHQYAQAAKEIEEITVQQLTIDGNPAMELLSADETQELEPETLRAEFGTLHSRLTAQLSVDQLLLALHNACKACGVLIEGNRTVTGIDIHQQSVRGVRCSNDVLPCEATLIAAGVWTSALCPELETYAHMEPVRGQAILVETERPLIKHIIKWDQRYVIPHSEQFIALGSTTEKNSGFNVKTTVDGIRQILTSTLQAVPALSDCSIKKVWAGLRPFGPDSKPHIGAVPGVERLFVATGHYKIGFGFAPVTASAIAELMTSGSTAFDLSGVAPRKAKLTSRQKQSHG